jgi:hypothetical protein
MKAVAGGGDAVGIRRVGVAGRLLSDRAAVVEPPGNVGVEVVAVRASAGCEAEAHDRAKCRNDGHANESSFHSNLPFLLSAVTESRTRPDRHYRLM